MLHLFNTVHNVIFTGTHSFQIVLLVDFALQLLGYLEFQRQKIRNCFLSDRLIAKYLNQIPGEVPRRMNGERHVRTDISDSDIKHNGFQACVTSY